MSTNDITGDRIASKFGDAEAKRRFDESFERIFGGKKDKPEEQPCAVDCGECPRTGGCIGECMKSGTVRAHR